MQILHLSDLHLGGADLHGPKVLQALFGALSAERSERGIPFDLVCLTGDVFDSSSLPETQALNLFENFHQKLCQALQAEVPLMIVPGNHDLRKRGLFGPSRSHLMRVLQDNAQERAQENAQENTRQNKLPRVFVHASHGGPATALLERKVGKLDASFLLHDSAHLARGWVSAGGIVRAEDIFHAVSQMSPCASPHQPIFFLLHHHLVATPLTDLGSIETEALPGFLHRSLHAVLPRVVAHADHEELTMTALGAGSAISALHSMGRPVLVLHGHKHIASARMLSATKKGHGDVMIVGAGSAGSAQRWHSHVGAPAVHLWPSFNVVEWNEESVSVEAVSFGWKGRSIGARNHRPLIFARREGSRFELGDVSPSTSLEGRRVETNEMHAALLSSDLEQMLDLQITRKVQAAEHDRPSRYCESIDVPAHTQFESDAPSVSKVRGVPVAEVELPFGESVSYRLRNAIFRSPQRRAEICGESQTPYEHLAMLNRYECGLLRLSLAIDRRAAWAAGLHVFATCTDLGSGDSSLAVVQQTDAGFVLEMRDVPPRTWVRIFLRFDPLSTEQKANATWPPLPAPVQESIAVSSPLS